MHRMELKCPICKLYTVNKLQSWPQESQTQLESRSERRVDSSTLTQRERYIEKNSNPIRCDWAKELSDTEKIPPNDDHIIFLQDVVALSNHILSLYDMPDMAHNSMRNIAFKASLK